MNDGGASGRGPVAVQPPECQLEGRVRLAEVIEDGAELDELVVVLEPRCRIGGDAVDRREGRTALRSELRAGLRVLLVTKDLPRDGLALHESADEVGRAEHVGVPVADDEWCNRHSLRLGGPQQVGLDLHPATGAEWTRTLGLEDQLLAAFVPRKQKGPGPARRAARQAPELLYPDLGIPENRRQQTDQRVGEIVLVHRRTDCQQYLARVE